MYSRGAQTNQLNIYIMKKNNKYYVGTKNNIMKQKITYGRKIHEDNSTHFQKPTNVVWKLI